MNFLINLFNRAIKGDNFRLGQPPTKYNDKIAQLNAVNPNQASKINTNTINKIQKTKSAASQSTNQGTTLPGTK